MSRQTGTPKKTPTRRPISAGKPDMRYTPRLERRITLTRAMLLAESVWRHMWGPVSILAAFFSLSFLGLWPRLPGWLHLLLLIGFVAVFAASLIDAARRLGPPTRARAIRRLERRNRLPHRPLSGLADRPAAALAAPQRGLWRAHLARLERALETVALGRPAFEAGSWPPPRARATLAAILAISLVVAGHDWHQRLTGAFLPDLSAGATPPVIDAWIAPPDYTSVPPILLSTTSPNGDRVQSAVLEVPEGSRFVARVHSRGAPRLVAAGRTIAFDALGKDDPGKKNKSGAEDDYGIELTLTQSTPIEIVIGRHRLGLWHVALLADTAPRVAFSGVPGGTRRMALKVAYRAHDDYGVTKLALHLTPRETPPPAGANDTLVIDIPVPKPAGRDLDGDFYRDLTAHPWAGTVVTGWLTATDAKGQIGQSEAIRFTLPERIFHHPVAAEMIAIRKALIANPKATGGPRRRLSALADRPARFNRDTVVYLGLRLAFSRLTYTPEPKSSAEVADLLWDLALRVEDEGLLLSERDLRQAMEDLAKALDRGAPPEELAQLTQQMRQALARFLRDALQQARKHPNQGQDTKTAARTIGTNALRRMMDELQALNEIGAREAARNLLADLRNILENLQAGGAGTGSGAAQELAKASNALDQLMEGERGLLGDTRGLKDTGKNKSGAASLAQRQQALRQDLGKALGKLGTQDDRLPGLMQDADKAMRAAHGALKTGQLGAALKAEDKALTALRKGAARLGQMMAAAQGRPGGGRGGSGFDPLGRPLSGAGMAQGDETVPRAQEIRRARRILDELRQRAGDYRRPRQERAYIERLLRRF